MARFRIRSKWKSVLAGVLVVATLFGAVMGIAAIFKKDTRTIGATSFSVGALNDKGQFQEYKQSIVSDYFECQGLSIDPDDNATGSYQVFYYNEDKVFLGSSEKRTSQDGVYNREGKYRYAKYARVVIAPAFPLNEEGVEEDDFKIRFWETAQYAGTFIIKVDKEQVYPYDPTQNILKEKDILLGSTYKSFAGTYGDVFNSLDEVYESKTGNNTISALKIPSKAKTVSVFVKEENLPSSIAEFAFANESKYVVDNGNVLFDLEINGWLVWEYTLTSESRYFTLEFSGNPDFMVFWGYN